MSIIGHEYTHMIENRMIGKGNVRSGFQAGAMGESSGDLVAAEYQDENGYLPAGDSRRYATGVYATGNKITGIRDYSLDGDMRSEEDTPETHHPDSPRS